MRLANYLTEGYSHSWEKQEFSDDQWAKILKGAKKIIKAAEAKKIKIMGPTGEGKPILSSTEIAFNGDADKDKSYETFEVSKKMTKGDFCKTDRKPYDKVAVSILALMKEVNPEFGVKSDGGPKAIKRVF